MEKIITILCTVVCKIAELFEVNELDKVFLPKAKRRTIYWGNKFLVFILQIILMGIIGYGFYVAFKVNYVWIKTVAFLIINIIGFSVLGLFVVKETKFCKKVIKRAKKYFQQIYIVIWSILIIFLSISILYEINFKDLFVNNAILSTGLATMYSIFLLVVIGILIDIFNNEDEAKYYFYKWGRMYYLYYTQPDGFVVYGMERNFKEAKQVYFIDGKELKRKYELHILND